MNKKFKKFFGCWFLGFAKSLKEIEYSGYKDLLL